MIKFSKLGDTGETSLLGGRRVPKYDMRPECYGTLDEAAAHLGVAKALAGGGHIREIITDIQRDLLLLGAELAVHPDDENRFDYKVTAEHVQKMETLIDELQQGLPLQNEFILPGANQLSAQIDVARTVIRRAERNIARLKDAGSADNPHIQQYINRLADALFILARYAEEQR